MASTRDVIAPPIFAEDASTTIPPTPIAGVSYRDPASGPASSPDGWPYAQLVNSADFNQLMFQWSSLLSIMDLKGVLGWSDLKDYTAPAIAFGSDGTVYKWLQESGPGTGAGVKDPVSEPLYWREFGEEDAGGLPTGYFYGFQIGNNSGAPNTTVDVGAGAARSSDNSVDISLLATLSGILQSSGAWAAGNNQNKLDTGARANSTWYHVFAIRRTSDGVGDILFSLSPTAPTLPSGYAGFQLIESIYVNSSGNIAGFINSGRSMLWVTPVRDVDTAALGASPTNFTISSPPGRRVKAALSIAHSGAERIVNVFQPSTTPGVPAGPAPGVFTGGYGVFTGDATDTWAMEAQVVTNTASQVAAIANAAGTTFYLVTKGWEALDR